MPGFGGVGMWEVILILLILLLVFGARRLPEIGSALGRGIREFKSSVREIESEVHRGGDRSSKELPRSEAPQARPTEAPRDPEAARPVEAEKRE